MRTSGSATRKYTISVILIGVLGAALVPASVWQASRWIDALADSQLAAEATERGQHVQRQVDGCLAIQTAELRRLGPLEVNPSLYATWRALLPELESALQSQPALQGVVIRRPEWPRPLVVGPEHLLTLPFLPPQPGAFPFRRQAGGLVGVAFTAPGGYPWGSGVEANVWITPRFLLSEHERLTDFVRYGILALGVVLYLLAAVVILVNRAQGQLIALEREKATRLRAMGEVAGGIAHEVRNPLNAISLSVQYLERLMSTRARDPQASDFARIYLEVGKVRKVMDNFVKFARPRDMVVGPMDIGEVVDEVLSHLAPALEAAEVRMTVVREGNLRCEGDREKLAEVMTTVVQNAMEAMSKVEYRELRVRVTGSHRRIRMTVRDTGEVLDEKTMRHIFEPYFTTRDNALGLGMTMARAVVHSHRGTIEAAPAQGGGCVVTIELPRRP